MKRNMMMTGSGIALTLLAAALIGCAGPGTATTKTPAPAASAAATLSGKVVETMDAGGYTYLCLEKDGKKTWVAAPVMKVSVGEELTLLSGAEMSNFPSKALNRSFDKIIFSGGVVPTAASAAKSSSDTTESADPIMIGKVVETMDAANYTYVNLEKDGKTAWAAVPGISVAVGDEVELMPGTVMGEFKSKLLKRTFANIYFAGGATVLARKGVPVTATAKPAAAEAAQLPSGHPKVDAGAQPAATDALPAGHPKVDAAAAVPAAPSAPAAKLTGKVVETAQAGGYTYICLEKDGKKTWAAVPSMTVTVGQEMTLSPGPVMTKFVSKSLNRTFDQITFSGGPERN